ncbi:helix-turn-helix transcriptional regulator [Coprobacillaceae bacterium CR2/5/TPMF4]|nr:helix-turn-helix transcriptional regulator [Coprobacillaceae bacterium CR2/5/TPMF4]
MKNRVKELRKQQNISQEALARSVRVTRQTITSIEVGKYTASLLLAYKIAKFLILQLKKFFYLKKINKILNLKYS